MDAFERVLAGAKRHSLDHEYFLGISAALHEQWSTDLATPTMSFHANVMNLLNTHCGSGMCHGSPDHPTGGVFLGSSAGMGADAGAAFAAIVRQPSGELGSMSLVMPGDLARSYLMHKLDGDQCLFETSRVAPGCQHSMPSDLETLLPVAERDIVRRWIAQGATAN